MLRLNRIMERKKYLFYFAHDLFARSQEEFRQAEINSLLKIHNIQARFVERANERNRPFWIVELPGDNEAKLLASRSFTLRFVAELWSHSRGSECFHDKLREFLTLNPVEVQKYFREGKSFKINVETFNHKIRQQDKVEKIEALDYLPHEGKIDLKTPDTEFWLLEYYGMDHNRLPEKPFDIFFARWVANGNRSLISQLSLQHRKFIGNTSMDPQLSLMMANQALVKPGDLVFDPFVGSGALLVSSAVLGAYVLGADIDYLMLHGKSKPTRKYQKIRADDERVLANLKQYNVEGRYIDVLVSDFSSPVWRDTIQFDSIITDPPYGIREATERIEHKLPKKATVLNENDVHYPSTSKYQLKDLYLDLMRFSAKHLRLGGRLVFWFPVYVEDYDERIIPQHPGFTLIANCEQELNKFTSRRLLTYEKTQEVEENVLDDMEVDPDALDFRKKFFAHNEKTRKERRLEKALLREIGRQEAMKRGKILEPKESQKVTSK